MFGVCCICKSNKRDNVLDPTTLDIMKIINRRKTQKVVKPVDELNISLYNSKKKEESNESFGCFSFFDVCYKNDDIKRVHFNSEYEVTLLSQE
jgi:hypothetical protein